MNRRHDAIGQDPIGHRIAAMQPFALGIFQQRSANRASPVFRIEQQQFLRVLERRMAPGLRVPAFPCPRSPIGIGQQARLFLMGFGQHNFMPDVIVRLREDQ